MPSAHTRSMIANEKKLVFLGKICPAGCGLVKHGGFGLVVGCFLLAVILTPGCKPKSENGNSSNYFKTPFQDECQFIVESVVSDLAEQMFYAKFHQLPDPKVFSVIATEIPGLSLDEPVYEVQIHLDPKLSVLKSEVDVNGPIWSPEVYQEVTEALANSVALDVMKSDTSEDTELLSQLTDGMANTIEVQNKELSRVLEGDFSNPKLHEEAAVLLGAFMLRDHSGYFYDLRCPLSRMTAHLAMAHYLGGTKTIGANGQMAEAMLLTLVGDEALALRQLDVAATNNAVGVATFVRALRARNTGDYRPLGATNGLTRIESIEWFYAMAKYIGVPTAWSKLSDDQRQTIDFVRIAYERAHSVEMGHQLLDEALKLELGEISTVYGLSQHDKLTKNRLVKALNTMPERCFTKSGKEIHVNIIGWGQWALFLQRHLCHAIQQDFYMLQYLWGVPDDAKQFSAKCDEAFEGLRLYPFVQRFDCTDVESYHKSVDDGFKVTVATPQLAPAECWNWLCYQVDFAPPYAPNPNPHVNEWHHHNPPPGTVYDLYPRLNHPSLIGRPDTVAVFEKLHALAPYDIRVADFIMKRKYNNKPTYDQVMDLYSNELPYSAVAVEWVAWAVQDQPDQYEKFMLQAGSLDPVNYYTLGDYALNRREEDKAAEYYEKGAGSDPDSVRVASYAVWRVRYYLKKGQTEKAREVADFGGEVYSSRGLEAKGIFYELTGDYDSAFDWFQKIDERYNEPGPLIGFCMRYKQKTDDNRFDAELQKRVRTLFPKGIEYVSLSDFHGPPSDGVLIKEQSRLVKEAGLKSGDVIVAVYGVRVHNFNQYSYGREWSSAPELNLIVWQDNAYREFAPSPPDHRFQADFGDYPPK